jgi:TRAP-type C4-dicarboxylate transport system permease small subunit
LTRQLRQGVERLDRWTRALENGLLVVMLAMLVLLGSTQILLRNVFSSSLSWGDEFVRLLVLWLALLGAIAASRDGQQIRIDLLSRIVPARLQWLPESLAGAFTTVVCGMLAWQSWRFVQDSKAYGDLLLGDWPAWIFQIILPVGFAVMCYRYALRTITQLVVRN